MVNLNKHTKTKPKPTLIFKNCSYTAQHRTVLTIFSHILQATIIVQMMSTEREEGTTTTTINTILDSGSTGEVFQRYSRLGWFDLT